MRIVEAEDTPEGTLKSMLARAESFDGVLIISLNKDGSQYLESSIMSMHQKAFLVAFAQAWLTQWFHAAYSLQDRTT